MGLTSTALTRHADPAVVSTSNQNDPAVLQRYPATSWRDVFLVHRTRGLALFDLGLIAE